MGFSIALARSAGWISHTHGSLFGFGFLVLAGSLTPHGFLKWRGSLARKGFLFITGLNRLD
jgi:hypothetical protein